MFDRRTARLRHSDKTTLLREMGISGNPQIILSGVNHDAPLERWWSYGAEKRIELAKGLKRMGVEMVTTPNYSLFIDRPRWDDLHSIKRIATTFEEFQEAQLPAALHVNGRTERDFERWGDFIKKHDEVAWISYEFGTGTGWAGRLDLHVSWLSALADSVGRPLSIVLRGGLSRLSELRNHYQAVTYLDTNVFMKTVKRQQARIEDGKLVWRHSSTPNGEALSRLARSNFEVVEGLFQP
ncbi:MAG: DUF4417 domain-containing protein [Pseudomonadales bacterium]|nr:DUF4417 domain-containing protein [Pseudomonadales bacterium]